MPVTWCTSWIIRQTCKPSLSKVPGQAHAQALMFLHRVGEKAFKEAKDLGGLLSEETCVCQAICQNGSPVRCRSMEVNPGAWHWKGFFHYLGLLCSSRLLGVQLGDRYLTRNSGRALCIWLSQEVSQKNQRFCFQSHHYPCLPSMF